MNLPPPQTFRDVVATVLVGSSVLCSVPALRGVASATRLSALWLIAAIALYANNAWVYFAAVFIVATVVTEIGFLENLAAIILRNKEFFVYRKEQLSPAEARTRAAAEIPFDGGQSEVTPTTELKPSDTTMLARPRAFDPYVIEQLALTYIEKQRGHAIERDVRFTREGETVVVDGLIAGPSGRPPEIYEVKLSTGTEHLRRLRESVRRMQQLRASLERITRQRYVVRLILVVPSKPESLASRLEDALSDAMLDFDVDIVDYDEIGYVPPI